MIYFAQAEGTDLVKIGLTQGEPEERIADLQTGCPHRLVLIAKANGGQAVERKLHAKFADEHVRGEWFRLTPRLVIYIAKCYAFQADNELLKLLRAQEKRIAALEKSIALPSPQDAMTAADDCYDADAMLSTIVGRREPPEEGAAT